MGLDKPNYTQVANLILDDLMRYMSGAELKVTLAIARQTFGYHRERYALTISDLETLTGLSRPAVVEAVSDGERRGMICREVVDGRTTYSLVINDEVLAVKKESLPVKKVNHDDGKESLPSAVKKVNRRSKESLPKSVNKVDQNTPVLKKEKESIKEREEDDLPPPPLDPIPAAWQQIFGTAMPADIAKAIARELSGCSDDAIIHGFKAAAENDSRKFSYIATCARNYVPGVAPQPKRYSVESGQPAPSPTPPPAPTPPMRHDDPWGICLAELRQTLPGGFYAMLAGSEASEAGTAPGADGKPVPLYRIAIAPQYAANGLNHFTRQAGPAIRRKLSSVLGKSVQIEIVAAAMAEPEPTP